MMDEKKPSLGALLVRVPILDNPMVGLRRKVVSIDRQPETGNLRIEVTSGFGIGDTLMHVEVEDHGRFITVGRGLAVEASVNEALRVIDENAGRLAPPDRPDHRENAIMGSAAVRLNYVASMLESATLGIGPSRSSLESWADELRLIESLVRANWHGAPA